MLKLLIYAYLLLQVITNLMDTFDIKLELFEKTFAVNFFGMINCFSIITTPYVKSQQFGHLAAIKLT